MSIDSSPLTSNRWITHPLWLRLMQHLQSPLLRNGYALVFNSVATSALGVLYWMLAARYYNAEIVGINAALINAMLFLSQTAQLNLGSGINRFLPTAGKQSNRFVWIVYMLTLLAAPLVCLVYFLGMQSWAPMLDSVFANRLVAVGFVVATMGWCIFAMQDNVLIGMRQATWVPVENLIFALGKILLLVAVAIALPNMGIFVSWVAPMIAMLLPVNWLIFRHLTPQHIEATRHQSESLQIGAVARYVGGDYFGSLVWTATIGLMPIIVLESVGATESAYFAIAWTIANSLYLVSRNMGMSLISEASLDRTRLTLYTRRTLLQTLKLIVPVALFVVIAAPWMLWLFGKDYSSQASAVLRLLALSAIPAAVTTIYLSVARVQRQLLRSFVVQALLCGGVVLISIWLLDRIGITGVGVAWLIGQTVMAAALLISDGRLHILDESWLHFASRLRNRWTMWRLQRNVTHLQPLIDSILTHLKAADGDKDWRLLRLLPVLADVTVAQLGVSGGKALAILKVPNSAIAVRYSQLQQQTLQRLHTNVQLGDWLKLVPRLLLAREENGQPYTVESIVPGVAMETLLKKNELRAPLLQSALDAIGTLHRQTAVTRTVDDELLQQWVDQPIARLQFLYTHNRNQEKQRALEKLHGQLHQSLAGKQLTVAWSHGDFAPCNILVSEADLTVSGIVDWEQSLQTDLPMVDLVFLLLTVRMQTEGKELGTVITELLADGDWQHHESAALKNVQMQITSEQPTLKTLVLLAWLRHVSMTVDKSERYRNHTLWRRNNIDLILSEVLNSPVEPGKRAAS